MKREGQAVGSAREETGVIQPAIGAPDDPLAAVERMIAELNEIRDREQSRDLKSAYTAAIDRLHAVAYRLQLAPPKARVIGLPGRKTPPPAAPEPPQRALPLPPVIVRARKPKRR